MEIYLSAPDSCWMQVLVPLVTRVQQPKIVKHVYCLEIYENDLNLSLKFILQFLENW